MSEEQAVQQTVEQEIAAEIAAIDAEQAQEQEHQEPQEPQGDPDLEARARRQGWRPADEYHGPQDKWVPAEKFLQRAEESLPMMRDRMRYLDQQVAQMQDAMRKQAEMTRQQAEQARQARLRALKEAQAQAVAEGDADRFRQIAAEEDRVRQWTPPEPSYKPPAPEEAPEFQSWMSRNTWYTQDPAMRAYADAAGDFVRKQNPNAYGQEFLESVTEEVRKRFPDRFEAQRPPSHRAVESGHRVGAQTKPRRRTYNDLPADVKQVCDTFVRSGAFANRDEYVAAYFAGDE